MAGMRWVVYGAGAVGGVLGGLLHEAGEDVVLVARGAHLDAVRRDGLILATPEGTRTSRRSPPRTPARRCRAPTA